MDTATVRSSEPKREKITPEKLQEYWDQEEDRSYYARGTSTHPTSPLHTVGSGEFVRTTKVQLGRTDDNQTEE
jgi:hypothetical protein